MVIEQTNEAGSVSGGGPKNAAGLDPIRVILPPDHPSFNSSHNPVVQVAENARYAFDTPDTVEAIQYSKECIARVEALPDELVPPLARQNIAEAKRVIRSYSEAGINFLPWEKTYLREKYELDPPDFYD